jgi:uncharacterized membrane protein
MTNVARVVLFLALVATTVLTFVLGVTDPTGTPSYPTKFLVWNLVLAWIPVFFAACFAAVRLRLWLLPLGLAWLAFLPNSPYLVTDLVHLEEGVDFWRHVLQYGFAAWTGILLGVVSLRLVHDRIERDFGAFAGWVAVIVSIPLCAIGIVIGRFQRWNSWDLVRRPKEVLGTTLEWMRSPFADTTSTGVALAVAVFFGLACVTIWSLGTAYGRTGSANQELR